jgi:hypothetical protein
MELLDDAAVQRLLTAAIHVERPQLRRRIEQVLTMKAAQRQYQPFPATPVTRPAQDALQLGSAITGSSYRVSQDDLTQHLLVVGRSGAGKTTLLYNLLDQLTVPFWAFDLKQDYRHLTHHGDQNLLVLPWTQFKFNPLQPPDGVAPRRWAQVFVDILGHATALLSGSKNYVLKQVLTLYRYYGLFEEVAPPYPSLFELQCLLRDADINYVRKTADYRDRVLNRLEAMTLAAGTVFDCSAGYALPDLLRRNVVFEFDGLATDVQNFLMEILFAAVYEYRVAHTHRGGGLRHAFVLDEGKRVFSVYKERQDAAGIPPIDELTAKMREFGEGLIVADQEATKLTDSLKANTATKLLLATGDATQFHEMTAAMHLTERQETVAHDLGIGEAVVQHQNHDPVLVQLADTTIDKTVSDTALRTQQVQNWQQLTATPRETTDAYEQAVDDAPTIDVPAETIEDQVDLSAAAEQLLEDVISHPFKSLTARYECFDNAYQGNKAKTELVDQGLVTEETVTPAAENRTLVELTSDGREYAETCLDVEPTQRGRGGIVHRYWQHRVVEECEAAGWTAKPELFDADVYVHTGDAEIYAEVAMGDNPREIDHMEQHLDAADAIWVLCRNETVRDGLRERLAENGLQREPITLRLVNEIRELQHARLP